MCKKFSKQIHESKSQRSRTNHAFSQTIALIRQHLNMTIKLKAWTEKKMSSSLENSFQFHLQFFTTLSFSMSSWVWVWLCYRKDSTYNLRQREIWKKGVIIYTHREKSLDLTVTISNESNRPQNLQSGHRVLKMILNA